MTRKGLERDQKRNRKGLEGTREGLEGTREGLEKEQKRTRKGLERDQKRTREGLERDQRGTRKGLERDFKRISSYMVACPIQHVTLKTSFMKTDYFQFYDSKFLKD